MANRGVDDEVLALVREFGRPVRFREIAEVLAQRGVTRSRVHNAVYRLSKAGHLVRSRAGTGMIYMVKDG